MKGVARHRLHLLVRHPGGVQGPLRGLRNTRCDNKGTGRHFQLNAILSCGAGSPGHPQSTGIVGCATQWTQVNANSFGDPGNEDIYSTATFDGLLCVGTLNVGTGAEVWSYDGRDWTQINEDGFGSSATVNCFAQFNGNLYVGMADRAQVFSGIAGDGRRSTRTASASRTTAPPFPWGYSTTGSSWAHKISATGRRCGRWPTRRSRRAAPGAPARSELRLEEERPECPSLQLIR